ncbi:protein UXT isoform 2 [Mus musculus]|uniref:protein UXT isoform 2 n=1 Tax=Mus musculus TaxID=10090 RepID=UPI0003D74B5C|nr:protein UXT isoform 2 [Mus musculus]|eukprot:XP_006527665.1 PREDICTED: protein UXT isoform X2 [Mus musculus]
MATPPKRRALDTVGEKVLRYETFISDVLQRDLQKVLDHRDKVYEQLSVYLQLRNVIERLQETNHSELYMQVDLGCNFFVDTVVLSDSLTKDSMNIKAHIHMMLEGLRELQGLQNFPEPSPH